MKNKLLILILVLWLPSTANTPAVEAIERAVVQVESSAKVGSGFLYRDRSYVVTNIHLIENANDIRLLLYNDVRRGRVVKVLKRYDLVLIELDRPADSECTVISSINTQPAANSTLYTLGHNGGGNINTLIDRSLRLGFTSDKRLSGLLPESIRRTFSQCKSPDPEIEIVYFEGTLLPGFSGAPIIDERGNLVAIVDGGLDRDASSISRGIAVNRLSDLMSSNGSTIMRPCGSNTGVTFSADRILTKENSDVVQTNGFTPVKTKTRTVEEMMATVDDPVSLRELANQTVGAIGEPGYMILKYDIYEDLESGAVICVPEGAQLEKRGDHLIAEFPNYHMAFMVELQRVSNPNALLWNRFNEAANKFQQRIVERDQNRYFGKHPFDDRYYMYQPDSSMSYIEPQIRNDEIVVNRISYMGYLANTDYYGNPLDQEPFSYSFQTLFGKGDIFLGAVALNDDSRAEYAEEVTGCILSGACETIAPSDCSSTCYKVRTWLSLVLGTYMNGFSNTYYNYHE